MSVNDYVLGTGITITFGTSGFTCSFKSFSLSEGVNEVDVTEFLSTVYRQMRAASLKNPMEITLRGNWFPDNITSAHYPIIGTNETVTFELPVPPGMSNGASIASTFFVRDFSVTAEVETVAECDVTLRHTGATVTKQDAS